MKLLRHVLLLARFSIFDSKFLSLLVSGFQEDNEKTDTLSRYFKKERRNTRYIFFHLVASSSSGRDVLSFLTAVEATPVAFFQWFSVSTVSSLSSARR